MIQQCMHCVHVLYIHVHVKLSHLRSNQLPSSRLYYILYIYTWSQYYSNTYNNYDIWNILCDYKHTSEYDNNKESLFYIVI